MIIDYNILCFWFLSIPPTLTMINQFSFCVVYPWWVILNFKINESYKTFDSNKSFRFCLNTLDIRPGGIPFGHPLGLGWLFQTVVSTLTESNFFSFCVSYPYLVKLVFIPCGVPLLFHFDFYNFMRYIIMNYKYFILLWNI